MKIAALIQTRYNSSRLPGKAVKEVGGLPLLWHVYRRVLGCSTIDEVSVAVGDDRPEPILDLCDLFGMHWRVGPEKDLLKRLIEAAVWMKADAVLRVRADCLFLDPILLDDMVFDWQLRYPRFRAMSNWPRRYCSEGLDAEIWTLELLMALDRDALCPREDFATYALKQGLVEPHAHALMGGEDLHMSIDTAEDLRHAEKVLGRIGCDDWKYRTTLENWNS